MSTDFGYMITWKLLMFFASRQPHGLNMAIWNPIRFTFTIANYIDCDQVIINMKCSCLSNMRGNQKTLCNIAKA